MSLSGGISTINKISTNRQDFCGAPLLQGDIGCCDLDRSNGKLSDLILDHVGFDGSWRRVAYILRIKMVPDSRVYYRNGSWERVLAKGQVW